LEIEISDKNYTTLKNLPLFCFAHGVLLLCN